MLGIEFSDKQKQKIRKIHNARCVLCGLGEKEGAGSHVASIVPRQDGGEAVISNGQILCTKHKNARFDAEKIDPKQILGKILLSLCTAWQKIKNPSTTKNFLQNY